MRYSSERSISIEFPAAENLQISRMKSGLRDYMKVQSALSDTQYDVFTTVVHFNGKCNMNSSLYIQCCSDFTLLFAGFSGVWDAQKVCHFSDCHVTQW